MSNLLQTRLVGRSRAINEVRDRIARMGPTALRVLILGETGTGKDLVARLHKESGREGFVPVNCAAVTEALFEAQMFGFVKGAFTGADRAKVGLLEQAHGGALFLDEIAELPVHVQAKLLRALDEGEVRRVGSTSVRA